MSGPPPGAPAVSVVVPVYNGAATIGACLESLLALRYPREQLEVVVVDNGSTDDTRERVRAFGPAVRLTAEATRGPAAARNRGVREARGHLIAFTDADCTVDPDWLDALVEPLGDPTVGIVGGRILSRRPCNRVELFGETIHDHRRAIERAAPPYAITMNWASRRAVLLEVGLFDEGLPRSEDTDLARRIHLAGYRLVYEPRAVIFHRNERTLWGLMDEGFLHAYYGVRVRTKHAAMGIPGAHPRSQVGRRLLRDLRQLARAKDRRHAMLQLLYDLGKAGGEYAALARGESRRRPPAGDRWTDSRPELAHP